MDNGNQIETIDLDSGTTNDTIASDTSLKDRVAAASEIYKEELANSIDYHLSDSMYMAISQKELNGQILTITHIIIADPSQIKYRPANGSYANGEETIEHAKNNCDDWVIGFNGSHFYQKDKSGRQDLINGASTNGIAIVNGELVDTSSGLVTDANREEMLETTTKGLELCIDKNGNMFTAAPGITARELINDYGVVQTFASFEERHLENGNWIKGDESEVWKERTYLCMVEPGEYYIVQGNGKAGSVTKYIQKELGCTFAKSLDQGGSVSMATKNKTYIKSDEGVDGRPVGDFLYFSD